MAAVEPQDLILVVCHQHPVGIDGDGAGGVAGAGVEAAAGWQRRGGRGAITKFIAGAAAAVSHRDGDRGQARAAWGDLQLAVGAAATEHQIGFADHRLIAAADAQLQIGQGGVQIGQVEVDPQAAGRIGGIVQHAAQPAAGAGGG